MSPRIGVILLDHGEPPEYNRHTYRSFRGFARELIDMGLIPKVVLKARRGTILMDRQALFATAPRSEPELVDAWLEPHPGPARFVPARRKLLGLIPAPRKAHWLLKRAGPGRGEPDFFQFYGFEIYNRWRQMDNHSPFYEQTQPQKEAVRERLAARYGDRVLVRCAYGIDPYPQRQRQYPHHVVAELLAEGCTAIAVAEHFHVISDSMSTHHCRKHVREALVRADTEVPVVFAEQLGEHPELVRGVVRKVREELAPLKPDSDVAIFLSNHGFPLTHLGRYDAAADCYHDNARRVFATTREAIREGVAWSGRLEVVQVFGQFLEEKYNPDGRNTRPREALARVAADGFRRVIDIPYEFPGDTVDVLIKLRQAYGLDPPRWDENFETRFERDGVTVKICSALFHTECRIRAYFERACEAVERCLALVDEPGSG